jgi:hypothetical protein
VKYLCLAYEEERTLDALSSDEWRTLRQETLDYVDELRRRGRLLVTHALQTVHNATTLRVRDGKDALKMLRKLMVRASSGQFTLGFLGAVLRARDASGPELRGADAQREVEVGDRRGSGVAPRPRSARPLPP